jgi:hypothetical protein
VSGLDAALTGKADGAATTTALGTKADKATAVTATAPLTGTGTLGAALTLGINEFNGAGTRGTVKDPVTATGKFLKDDGTWGQGPNAVSGVGGVFPFTYNTSTVETITGNQMRGNNATFVNSTKLWVSVTTVDGLDVTLGLSRIKAGFQVYVQDYTSASRYVIFNVTADAFNTGHPTYFEIPVIVSSSLGTIPGGKAAFQSINPAAAANLFSPTTTAAGLTPGANGVGGSYYLNGVGGWSVPAGGGGGGITTDQAIDAVQAAMTATAPIVVTHDSPTQTIKLTGPTIETQTGAQGKVDAHTGQASGAHAASAIAFTPGGTIAGSTVQTAVAEVATDAATALTNHEADTTAIHGIADTSVLETVSGSQAKVNTHTGLATGAHAATAISFAPGGTIAATTAQAAIAEVATDAASALATHEADTTAIHGIADTSLLETQAGATSKVSAHTGLATGAHAATAISYAGSTNLVAANVEAALDELDAEKQPLDSDLTAIGNLAPANNDVIQRKGGVWVNSTPATLKTDLAIASGDVSGLGSLATKSTVVSADITDLTIATGDLANDAVTYAKIQNVTAVDKILGRVTSGAGDIEEITCTAAGRNLIDDADITAQRATLGLTGAAVLALPIPVANGGTGAASASAARTALAVPEALNSLAGIWKGTQAQYTALGTYDSNTLYAIVP